jgi:uncharacterized protein (TIGR02145 family)
MKTSLTYLCKILRKAIAFLTAAIFSLILFSACGPHKPTVETVRVDRYNDGMAFNLVVTGATFTFEVDSTPYFKVYGKVVSDGDGEILDMGICMSKHALPTIADTKKSFFNPELIYGPNVSTYRYSTSGNASMYKVEFYRLEMYTTYYFRAYAQNSAGVSYGEVIEANTNFTPIVKTVGAKADSRTEATIKGSVNPLTLPTEVWFEVWRDGESVRRLDVPNVSGDKAVEVSTTVSGLTAGEEYFYTLKAKNSTGTVSGETKTFRLYYEQVSDYDGNKYWTVKIGSQIWLESNLKTTRFANGDAIPKVQPDNEWVAMKSPAYCYTKNDPELGKVYGALYNNYVGLDSRGLIDGYHTPSIQEYETLVSYLGGGTSAARKLKSATDDWYEGRKGDNSSGFNALPGGWRSDRENPFSPLYYQATFQTTTPMEGVGAYYGANVYYNSDYVMTAGASPGFIGRSIRLIKN